MFLCRKMSTGIGVCAVEIVQHCRILVCVLSGRLLKGLLSELKHAWGFTHKAQYFK